MTLQAVDVTTATGLRLSFMERDGTPSRCEACQTPGPGESFLRGTVDLVDLQLDAGRVGDCLTLCGTCIAEGLAILLGRRHVEHGGLLEDLSYASPNTAAPTDASPDPRAGRDASRGPD